MSGIESDSREAFVLLQPGKTLDEIAAEAAGLLGRVGVQLAVAEAGTGGEVGRLLAASAGERAVLTQKRIYRSPEDLAEGLRVSPAKVEAFGAVSAMVAAEAAAELIDTYEGGWGLVIIAPTWNLAAEHGVQSERPGAPGGFIAFGTPSTTIVEQCPADHLVWATFHLLIKQAARRLQRT
jgi:nicotinamide mononucleotide (NMN) deamidase PncC